MDETQDVSSVGSVTSSRSSKYDINSAIWLQGCLKSTVFYIKLLNYSHISIIFEGIFDNTLNREGREQRKISAPPTMETPDRRTSFIKNSSTKQEHQNLINDKNSQNNIIQNDNENSRCLPSVIMEQVEPLSGQ